MPVGSYSYTFNNRHGKLLIPSLLQLKGSEVLTRTIRKRRRSTVWRSRCLLSGTQVSMATFHYRRARGIVPRLLSNPMISRQKLSLRSRRIVVIWLTGYRLRGWRRLRMDSTWSASTGQRWMTGRWTGSYGWWSHSEKEREIHVILVEVGGKKLDINKFGGLK